jgi:4-aminobutyrate aminotransferase / (S)-3-amino-2-methylpropionate transaminase / 5-aminovalerate transaminase
VGGLGGTYGGNPSACAAALAAIHQMEADDLAGRARWIGEVIRPRLDALASRYPFVGDVRGRGAMQAVEIVKPGTKDPDAKLTLEIARACHSRGVVVLTCGTYSNVLRFLPPLVIGDALLADALEVLDEAFAAV